MSRFTWAMNVPIHRWLIRLAEGWRLPWIVEPIGGYVDGCDRPAVNHGAWALIMTREDQPESGGALAATPHPAARHTAEDQP